MQFIQNFSAIARSLTSMLKTGLSSRSSKLAKRDTISISHPNNISFLTFEAKESFQKLKTAFCEELVLQYFDVSNPIRFETDVSGQAKGVFYANKIITKIGTRLLIIRTRCTLLSGIMKPMMLSC